MVHALKTLGPCLLDKPTSCTRIMRACSGCNSSAMSAIARRGRWLNLLAEYKHNVVHIPGRTNPDAAPQSSPWPLISRCSRLVQMDKLQSASLLSAQF